MKTICITGSNGLLGQKLAGLATDRYRVVGLDLHDGPVTPAGEIDYHRVDITDRPSVERALNRIGPDAVFHTASFTDVDGCEREEAKARAVNVEGTRHMAEACRIAGAVFVHMSTDYVFDGEAGPYDESDTPHPISIYGATKLESERTVADALDDFIIARTMVLFGHAPGVRLNFATWVVRSLREGKRIRVVTDQVGTPTLADDLAGALLLLYEEDARGVYHCAGPDLLSRYEMAVRVAEAFDLDASLIGTTTTERLRQAAPRPLISGLVSAKWKRGAGPFHSLKEALTIMRGQQG